MFRFMSSPKYPQRLGLALAVLGFIIILFTAPFELNVGIGIGLTGLGFGIWVWGTAQMNGRKIEESLNSIIKRIESLREEILKEIKERQDSSPPIVASLQAFTQYYMDYIAKQKESENEKS